MAANALTPAPIARLKRTLGLWDFAWLCVVAIANLNVIPVIASNGAITVWLWFAALAFFFLPQGITVVELSHRMPHEGGLYIWAKETFGDLHGFLCGWAYWTSNVFYIPTLLFYLSGIVTYTGGPATAGLGDDPYFVIALTVGILWLITFMNILGLGVGKWVNNAGAMGTLTAAALLIVLAAVTLLHRGPAHASYRFATQAVDWKTIPAFAVICFALVGLELGPVMGDEIRDPARTVPRGVLIGGLMTGALYLLSTLALLLAVPQKNLKVLQGVLQGVGGMAQGLGAGRIVLLLAALMFVSILGCISAWLNGASRILFVSGLDQYLPRGFGRLHAKYRTPHVALIGMAILSTALICVSFIGQASVKEAYVTLLDLSVVLQMLSYLYLFGALTVVAFRKHWTPGVCRRRTLRFASISGLATTGIGLIVAFVPSHQVDSVWRFEIKMVATSVVFLSIGAGLFLYYSRHRSKR